ncbi:hypothetical protein BG011_009406 [Mortierella polycephala]|uniref:CBM21 domain-containing protein n=1 Tax=Mortierella polycephala TaxID=41804 RepID=A0A9P6PLA6_9FUNG|nr:hypothetical protein BG011_009406 [Mortierella polycephala]
MAIGSVHKNNQVSPAETTVSVATSNTSAGQKHNAHFYKNGLPIKSALKRPTVAPTVNTNPMTGCRPSTIRSHSSPTPLTSPKYVHFNTQLEHIRHFLQGEEPSWVAERATIVDTRRNSRAASDVQLTLPNWIPTSADSFHPVSIDSDTAPLRFENVILSEDQSELKGKILVQNIAFHKRVSVRYTIDFWQTYSEVSAEFKESISGTSLDRFVFTIPLDMERAQVEKTFCMAVCYQVVGREFWDSNNGMNYQIECKRVVVVDTPPVSDLSKQLNSLLLPDYSKPVLKKKLANRYNLSTSLSAAHCHSFAIPAGVASAKMEDPFCPAKITDPNTGHGSSASQTAYRASEYITTSPSSQIYHHSLYASSPKFINTYLSAASPPDHFHFGIDTLSLDRPINKRGRRNKWNTDVEAQAPTINRSQSFPVESHGSFSTSPSKASAPISIPVQRGNANRPAVGSSSYYDLVDRYCFYESSPHNSPYSSYPNSPPAPCIRG